MGYVSKLFEYVEVKLITVNPYVSKVDMYYEQFLVKVLL